MNIYELTEAERATMLKLINEGLVVSLGKHASVKRDLADAIRMLKGIAASSRKNGYEGAAVAVENMLRDVLKVAA